MDYTNGSAIFLYLVGNPFYKSTLTQTISEMLLIKDFDNE